MAFRRRLAGAICTANLCVFLRMPDVRIDVGKDLSHGSASRQDTAQPIKQDSVAGSNASTSIADSNNIEAKQPQNATHSTKDEKVPTPLQYTNQCEIGRSATKVSYHPRHQ